MLNYADTDSFSDLVSVYLKVFDHYTWNFKYFEAIQQVLNSDFLKFRILEWFNFHPCISEQRSLICLNMHSIEVEEGSDQIWEL